MFQLIRIYSADLSCKGLPVHCWNDQYIIVELLSFINNISCSSFCYYLWISISLPLPLWLGHFFSVPDLIEIGPLLSLSILKQHIYHRAHLDELSLQPHEPAVTPSPQILSRCARSLSISMLDFFGNTERSHLLVTVLSNIN